MLESILVVAVPALITVLAPYLVLGVHAGVRYLQAKAGTQRGESFAQTFAIVDELAGKAVALIAQTYVTQLKASGKFDGAAQAEALRQAVGAAKIFAAGQLPALRTAGVSDVEAYLRSLVEAKIGESKAAALPPFLVSAEYAAKMAAAKG